VVGRLITTVLRIFVHRALAVKILFKIGQCRKYWQWQSGHFFEL